MFQTRGGGRSVTEMVLNFEVDGMIDQVPMFVVADLGARGTLEEVRLYCHATFVPNLTPYRRPIFPSAHLEMGDPGIMTGAMREYYVALHHMPAVDVDRMMRCIHPDCVFGGYGPVREEPAADSSGRANDAKETTSRANASEEGPGGTEAPKEDSGGTEASGQESGAERMRRIYESMATYIPSKVAMRYETLIDDGITGVIEWVHVISDAGRRDLGRIALSGVSSYQRGEDGRLISIRISDYAGFEKYINWEEAGISREEAEKINAVHEFPAGVGAKSQEIL